MIRWAGVRLRLVTPCDPGTVARSPDRSRGIGSPPEDATVLPSHPPRCSGRSPPEASRDMQPPVFLPARDHPEQPPPANARRESRAVAAACGRVGSQPNPQHPQAPGTRGLHRHERAVGNLSARPGRALTRDPSANNRSRQHLLVSATSAMQSRDHRCRDVAACS